MLIGRRGSNWFFVQVSVPPLSNPSYAPDHPQCSALTLIIFRQDLPSHEHTHWLKTAPSKPFFLLLTLLFKVPKLHVFFHYPLLSTIPTLIHPYILSIHFEHFLLSIPIPSYFTVFISPSAIMFQLSFILTLSFLLQSLCLLLSSHPFCLIIVKHTPPTHPIIPFDLALQSLPSTQESVQSFSLLALQPHPSLNHPQSNCMLPYNPAILLPIPAQSWNLRQ